MKNANNAIKAFVLVALMSGVALGSSISSVGTGGAKNWSNPSTWVGSVVPASSDDATIAGSDIVVVDADAAVHNCTVQSGATLNAAGHTLTLNGVFDNEGQLYGSTGLQTGSAVFSFLGNLTNNGNIDIGSGAATLTLSFVGGSGAQAISGNGNINAQNIVVNNSAGVVLSTTIFLYGPLASGTLTLTSGLFNTSANLTLGSQSVISRSGGSLSGTPSFAASTDVTYTGSNPISTGPELPGSNGLGNLTINCSSGVTLGSSTSVNGNLIFSNGNLILGANDLTVGSTSSINNASSSNYIVTNGTGFLIQNVPGTNTNVTFPVGTSSRYNPVTLNNFNGTADKFSVRVAGSTTGELDATRTVHDQWTINAATNSLNSVTMTLNWNAADQGGSFASGSAQIGRWVSGSNWTLLATGAVSGSDPYSVSNTSPITSNFSNSIYSIGGPGSGLPIELTSFVVTPASGKVDLAWATATEMNNYGFDVERGTVNSQQLAVSNWEKVGFVQGQGTTNAPQKYSFTDATARMGKYSYRLKQIDRDGKFIYHQAVEVTVGVTPNTVFLDNNYPNPFNPSTKISFVLGTTGRATLKVFNIIGQEVATLADGVFNAGDMQEVTFDASQYSSGIYYYQLKTGSRTEIKKMMLLK